MELKVRRNMAIRIRCYDSLARESPWADRKSPERQGAKLTLSWPSLALLFVTLPTVNLINVNISRILERASEIGVRKAFGAPTRTLVAQFVVENVILTLAGGAIGLVLSALVLRALNQSGFIAHSAFAVNLRVFAYGTLLAIGVRAHLRRLPRLAHGPAPPRRRAQGRTVPMTRHLIRLIWNRKRQNLLLAVEILCSFLVLFVVVLRAPLRRQRPGAARLRHRSRLEHRRRAAAELPAAATAMPRRAGGGGRRAGSATRPAPDRRRCASCRRSSSPPASFTGPYANSTWGSGMDFTDGRHFEYRYNARDRRLPARCCRCRCVAGRGFSREDDGAGADPVLLNCRLAREMFGDGQRRRQDPPGEGRSQPDAPADRSARAAEARRRRASRTSASTANTPMPRPVMFERMRLDGDEGGVPDRLLIRVRPGTTATFEPVLVRRLQREAPDWSFEVSTLEHLREKKLSDYIDAAQPAGGRRRLPAADGGAGPDRRGLAERHAAAARVRPAPRRRRRRAARCARQVLAEMAVMTTLRAAGRRRARWRSCRSCRCRASWQRRARRLRRRGCALGGRHLLSDPGVRLVPEPPGDADSAGRRAALRVAAPLEPP